MLAPLSNRVVAVSKTVAETIAKDQTGLEVLASLMLWKGCATWTNTTFAFWGQSLIMLPKFQYKVVKTVHASVSKRSQVETI